MVRLRLVWPDCTQTHTVSASFQIAIRFCLFTTLKRAHTDTYYLDCEHAPPLIRSVPIKASIIRHTRTITCNFHTNVLFTGHCAETRAQFSPSQLRVRVCAGPTWRISIRRGNSSHTPPWHENHIDDVREDREHLPSIAGAKCV